MLDAERPALLDIVTPPPTHLAFIRAAVARGVRCVVCQKPFCEGVEQAEEAAALAEAAGVVLVVHENFRFQPWHAEAARLLAAGAVGELYQVAVGVKVI